MIIAKTSAIYPETGLTPTVEIYGRLTGVLFTSGTASEVGSTKVYRFDFTPEQDVDYISVYKVPGYEDVPGVVWKDSMSWNDLIENNSDVIGSFGYKFNQYGGVSHVIHDKSSGELSLHEKQVIEDTKKLMEDVKAKLSEKKTLTPEDLRLIESTIKVYSPEVKTKEIDMTPLVKLYKSLKESVDEIDKKVSNIKMPEIPESEDAEIITGVLDDVSSEIKEKLNEVLDVFKGYDDFIQLLQSDATKYKKLIELLTK